MLPPRSLPLALALALSACALSSTREPGEDAGPRDAGPADCAALLRAWQSELRAIASCSADAECGLELDGPAGCRVARAGEDDAAYRAAAETLRTSCPHVAPRIAPECPPAEPGLVCREGICTRRIEADCFYDQQPRSIGDEFPSTDGINSCTCDHVGSGPPDVGCTLII